MKENEEIEKEAEVVEEEVRLAETPEEEIRRLQEFSDAKAREAEENYNRFLRATADLDNYRKRTEKEKAEAIAFANETLIEEILPTLDNFERALSHADGAENLESLQAGVKMTVDQMYAVLKRFGLQEIKAAGEKFDPAVHHAITEEESEDAAPGTVTREFQKGYYLKGRLLRPAMVAVSKKPEVH